MPRTEPGGASAQSAAPPLLGRVGKAFRVAARVHQGAAHHRQEGHRHGLGRCPCPWHQGLTENIMSRSARDKIKLVSSAGTGHYYTTDKNKRNSPEKLEFKKYDPVVRKHVIYREARIK